MNDSAAEIRRVQDEPDGPVGAAVTHPERTDDPCTLRWITDGRILSPDPLPATLQSLLDERIAAAVVVRPGRVLVTLTEGRTWPEYGPRVRDAVLAALREPSPTEHDVTAEEVAAVAAEIIDEIIVPVATAHAGDVDLVSATRDTVRVRLSGACRHCPLSPLTVQGRLAGELNRRLPDQGIQVIEVNGGNRIARVRDRLLNRPPTPRQRPADR
jgi:NFU1 iron-sulfur cluster scaffold homolog, mitochondrial